MLDRKLFTNLMTALCDMFDKKSSEFIYDAYYDALKDFDYSQVELATRKVIASHRYNTLPKPADILDYLENSKEDRALIAWLQVKNAIETYGYTDTLEFADPIISNVIIQMGGWIELCSTLIKDLPFVEKEFMDIYRLYSKREIDKPVKLSGFFEITNRANGFLNKIPEPVRIGTPANLQVISGMLEKMKEDR